MEQLTLEQAAQKHALYKAPVYGEHHAIEGFKAGAEWQKEQYKELLHLYRQALGAYDIRYPDAKQLLAGYTNRELFNKINAHIERIQD